MRKMKAYCHKLSTQKTVDILSHASLLGLQLAALILLASLLMKAIFDVDTRFDSWWYHLPWAAKIAGLMPSHEYLFEPLSAVRFEGFPMLPEFLQGAIWRITGRVENANLVSFLSLICFIIVLKSYFNIAWWLSVPALLAVPLIQGQATSTYVDLMANFAMAVFLMLIFLIYARKRVMNYPYLFVMAIAAIFAANSKLQLMPVVALALLFCMPPAITWVKESKQGFSDWKVKVSALIIIAVIIFFVPLKNVVTHGNPVYPLKVEVLGYELNSAENLPPASIGGGEMADSPRVVKWFYSVFEIGMGPLFNVKRWQIDSAAPEGAPMSIQGGLFGHYVAFHLLLLIWLLAKAEKRERNAAILLVVLTMIVSALMPASNLLRYYMFWFICVISLNLYFLSALQFERVRNFVGIIFLMFVILVIDITDQNYTHTYFYSSKDLLSDRVNPEILQKLKQGGNFCLVLDNANEPFLYAPIWHDTKTYTVKAGPFDSAYPKEVERACKERNIVYSQID